MAGVLPATLGVASRSEIAPIDFVNFRPLPPEYNATPVCNQGLTEHHDLNHSPKMFIDHVTSRWITFTLWQNCGRLSRTLCNQIGMKLAAFLALKNWDRID